MKRAGFILLGVVFLGTVLPFYYFADPEAGRYPSCPLYQASGIYCTGCGSQRAFHDLLHLDLAGAFRHNILFIPVVLLLAWHAITRLTGTRTGMGKSPLDYRHAPRVLLAVLIGFTILRNLPWEPFRSLAP